MENCAYISNVAQATRQVSFLSSISEVDCFRCIRSQIEVAYAFCV